MLGALRDPPGDDPREKPLGDLPPGVAAEIDRGVEPRKADGPREPLDLPAVVSRPTELKLRFTKFGLAELERLELPSRELPNDRMLGLLELGPRLENERLLFDDRGADRVIAGEELRGEILRGELLEPERGTAIRDGPPPREDRLLRIDGLLRTVGPELRDGALLLNERDPPLEREPLLKERTLGPREPPLKEREGPDERPLKDREPPPPNERPPPPPRAAPPPRPPPPPPPRPPR